MADGIREKQELINPFQSEDIKKIEFVSHFKTAKFQSSG